MLVAQTYRTRAGVAQQTPGVNTRRMSVTPEKLQGVASELFDLLQVDSSLRRVTNHPRIGRATHVRMSPFALDPRTDGAQSRKRVYTLMVIVPDYCQRPLLSIGGY